MVVILIYIQPFNVDIWHSYFFIFKVTIFIILGIVAFFVINTYNYMFYENCKFTNKLNTYRGDRRESNSLPQGHNLNIILINASTTPIDTFYTNIVEIRAQKNPDLPGLLNITLLVFPGSTTSKKPKWILQQ